MNKDEKNAIISAMKDCPKGIVGLLAISLEKTLVSVPVAQLYGLMALEMVAEAEGRASNKPENAGLGFPSLEYQREIMDLVRDHLRSLSDEEFEDFISEETLKKTMDDAINNLKKMSGTCQCDGNCNGCGEDDDGETMLN